MKAIMAVRLRSGSYHAHPEAEPEDWDEIKADAVSIHDLGPVEGLANFRHAVRVINEDRSEKLYLLDGDCL